MQPMQQPTNAKRLFRNPSACRVRCKGWKLWRLASGICRLTPDTFWGAKPLKIGRRRVQLRHAGVDQHTRIGMVDDVHIDRHPLALGEQVWFRQAQNMTGRAQADDCSEYC